MYRNQAQCVFYWKRWTWHVFMNQGLPVHYIYPLYASNAFCNSQAKHASGNHVISKRNTRVKHNHAPKQNLSIHKHTLLLAYSGLLKPSAESERTDLSNAGSIWVGSRITGPPPLVAPDAPEGSSNAASYQRRNFKVIFIFNYWYIDWTLWLDLYVIQFPFNKWKAAIISNKIYRSQPFINCPIISCQLQIPGVDICQGTQT